MVNKHAACATTGRSVMICEHKHTNTHTHALSSDERKQEGKLEKAQEVDSRNYGANLKYEEITHNTVDENESICHWVLSTIHFHLTLTPTDSHAV